MIERGRARIPEDLQARSDARGCLLRTLRGTTRPAVVGMNTTARAKLVGALFEVGQLDAKVAEHWNVPSRSRGPQ